MRLRTRRAVDRGDLRTHDVVAVTTEAGTLFTETAGATVQPDGTLLGRAWLRTDGDLLISVDLTDDELRDLIAARLNIASRREATLAAVGAALQTGAAQAPLNGVDDALETAGTTRDTTGQKLRHLNQLAGQSRGGQG